VGFGRGTLGVGELGRAVAESDSKGVAFMNRRKVVAAATTALIAAGGSASGQGQPREVGSGRDVMAGLRTFSGIGKERPILEAGREVEVFRYKGAGCLTHMWFAMDSRTRIRVYVDGEARPSVDMAQDLGHGYAHGSPPEPWGVARFGRQGGVYNTYRIPFGSEVRVTVLPTTDVFDSVTKRDAWWIIRGTEGLQVLLGGLRLPDSARLRLYHLDGHRAQPLEEFTLCDATGSGALYQVTLAAQGDKPSGTSIRSRSRRKATSRRGPGRIRATRRVASGRTSAAIRVRSSCPRGWKITSSAPAISTTGSCSRPSSRASPTSTSPRIASRPTGSTTTIRSSSTTASA